MCGISFTCCIGCGQTVIENKLDKNEDTIKSNVNSRLQNRGPDSCNIHTIHLTDTCHGTMIGCVLHLRGNLTPQPVTDDKDNALLWNGEIFDGIQVIEDENDTQILFDALTECTTDRMILKVLETIHGPWAFIYWQADAKKLWFGRDMYGRRSLLWHLPSSSDNQFILTSVTTENQDFAEIPSVGVFVLDMSAQDGPPMTLYPWFNCRWPGTSSRVIDTPGSELPGYLYPIGSTNLPTRLDLTEALTSWIPEINKNLDFDAFVKESEMGSDKFESQSDQLHHILANDSDLNMLSEMLIEVLQKAVEKRVTTLPRNYCRRTYQKGLTSEANIAILFSGGLDSTILAALADRCIPPDEPIDLLNVAFEQRPIMNKKKLKEKKQGNKHGRQKLKEKLKSAEKFGECLPADSINSVSVYTQQQENISCDKLDFETTSCQQNAVHINGSSGTVSCVPAKLDEVKHVQEKFDPFDVPDRATGRTALAELNPNRKWNFIEINVTQKEVQEMRQSHISSLIYPLQTVLDDSIGCAVWFASRGIGILGSDRNQEISSKARVILCGMAADEQFAGYSRHRVTFKTKGWEGLIDQVEEEMWRISSRNLGRDDRIITDHGKESRFPFLDETFTQFVSTIPIYKKADLRLPRGLGEKLLLRLCAYKLGLFQTALQPKRAIQFGSKIAKMDNNKEKGSDTCDRLSHNLS